MGVGGGTMPRIASIVVVLVLSSVLLAAVPVGAQGTPEPVDHAVEDAAFHARWAVNDTGGFVENHTTDPHRDPVAHSLWLACWTADDGGVAVGPVAEACAPFYEPAEPSPPVQEEQDAEANGTDDPEAGDAGQAAAEAAGSARQLAQDVQDDPQGAPEHVGSFLSRTLVWVEDHVLEPVRDLMGGSAGVAGAGVDASVRVAHVAQDASTAAAGAGADAGRSAVGATVASVTRAVDAVSGAAVAVADAVVGSAETVADASAATVDAAGALAQDVSSLAADAVERVRSLWSPSVDPVADAPSERDLPASGEDPTRLLDGVRERVPVST